MAEENEIIAIFKADIEQYKKDVQEAADITGKLDTKVEQVAVGTNKLEKNVRGASRGISTLSKGLGGVAGLLGVTGRLFGINTDKIEALVFASREFVRVGQDVARAQKLATSATIASTAATTSQTVAERILNTVRSAGTLGIGLLITGVVALGAAIYNYIGNLKEEEKQLKRKADIDREQLKINNDLTKSFNARSKMQAETNLAEGIRTGLVTEQQAEEIQVQETNRQRVDEINKEIAAQRLASALASGDAFGKLTIAESIRINGNKKKLEEAAEAELQVALADVREKYNKIASDEAKKEAEKKKAEALKAQKELADALAKQDLENLRAQIRANSEFEKSEIDRLKKLADDEEEINKFNRESAALTGEVLREEAKKTADEEEKINQQRIADAQQTANLIFAAQQAAFDKKQELLNKEIENQDENIQRQRDLADRGLENTLAFEEKRAADLQRQQQKEVEQQKKIKLLETFLNSLAEYSKTDPDTALSKALLQVALATAASAVFAEEGGIIGEIGERSHLSRRHKGGGDVLLHAQKGEGILSRDEMGNLGRRNFHLLKDAARFPIRDDIFGMPQVDLTGGYQPSNSDVVKELKALQHIVRNKKESHWDVNRFGDYINTTLENGIKTVTKGKLKKPRLP